jgi:outer membrane autotransporter protein
MSAAVDAARQPNPDNRYGIGVFAAVSGGSTRYDTGSSVDVSGVSVMAGVSKGIQTQPGKLVVGAFIEYGDGSYDTYSSFHGDGDLDHVGGGIIGRFDFAGGKTGHFYTEGSARMGSIDNDFGGLFDASGREAKYDASSTYYGIHLGSGYVWNLTDKAALALYARYFWTQQKGDTVRLSTGETVDFDNINSHRMRVGTRFSYSVAENISPYLGVAYEHEFDGEARAQTNGFAIKAPSIDGGSGVGELGVAFKPTKDVPLAVDLGVQGYTGTREGVTGTLHLRYDF